jgi:hypothetical protein
VDTFLENARRIFEVARSDDSAEPNDFALLIRPDGGLHFVMDSPVLFDSALQSAALRADARIAYRVTRTHTGGVRVAGRDGNQECVLAQHTSPPKINELLRDQPLYRITSPLTLSA